MDVSTAWYRWHSETLILSLRVQAGTGVNRAASLHGNRVKLKITAQPIEGRANRALAHFLAAEFGVPRRNIDGVRGASSRDKEVTIEAPLALPRWFAEFGGQGLSCGR